jgi:hypothetical protein
MSSYDLFRLRTRPSLFDTPDIKRAVLSRKSADPTHVITVIGKLVAREAVLARIGQSAFWVRECVQVLALPSVRAAPARKKETAIAYSGCICASQSSVLLDIAARLRFCLTRRKQSVHGTGAKPNQGIHTWSNCPLCHRQPTCYTICLQSSEYKCDEEQWTRHALYSFPVCGAVSLSTSPGFTCFRAGLSFFCLGTMAFAATVST